MYDSVFLSMLRKRLIKYNFLIFNKIFVLLQPVSTNIYILIFIYINLF